MSRQYPFEPTELNERPGENTRGTREARLGFGVRSAQVAATWLLAVIEWRRRRQDLSRFILSIFLLLAGIGLGGTAGIVDNYLHRGVESGDQRPYVVQPTGKELATNVDLRLFPDAEIENVARELSQSGFRYVRQDVSWAQVESSAGQYDWTAYDAIVNALSKNGIQVIAVVGQTPGWASSGDVTQADDRPPGDPVAFQRFMQELTARYGGQVPFVQIWEHPNLSTQWGGTAATAESFLPVLAAAFNGARAGNPEVRIVTPELAQRSDQPSGPTDLEFLQDLYDMDAAAFMDIIGVSVDGGTLSPDDRRVDPDRENLSRAILFRDIAVRAGHAETPIWATSYGWSAQGDVTRDRQAEYVVRGLNRSWSEWPWMGLMVQWEFIDPDPDSANGTYAVVLADGRGTPLYAQLTRPEIQARSQMANTGFAPMDSGAISYVGTWQDQHLEGRTFKTTSEQGSSTTISFRGTGLIAYVRTGPQSGRIMVELDGKPISGGFGESGEEWSFRSTLGTDDFPHMLLSGLPDTQHTVTLTLVGEGEFTLGGLEVVRDAPFVWPVILITVGSLLLLFLGVRSLAYLVAVRAGHLRRKEALDAWPQLPQMPDWRPGRRI